MQKLTGYKQQDKEFIALLPVGGRFTMNAEEAAEAAKIIKPTLAIPMHWGSVIGSEKDAKEFVELCSDEGIRAEILEKEWIDLRNLPSSVEYAKAIYVGRD